MRRYTGLLTVALLFYLTIIPSKLAAVRFERLAIFGIDQSLISSVLTDHLRRNEYPETLSLSGRRQVYEARVTYTLDSEVQERIEKLYRRYRPDYAAFVAMEPTTGEIIALASWAKNPSGLGNLALRSNYPAASVFKVVTAAAAIDQGKIDPDTILPFNGKRTSLYKRQVFRHRDTKWTRRPTLTEAFAQSINPVFARIGVFQLGSETLLEYADRFAFNREFAGDVIVSPSVISLSSEDEWALAEAASGFTRDNTLSPWHGAMLASAIVNDGVMIQPSIVKALNDEFGVPLYTNEPRVFASTITPQTAKKLQRLMRETVMRGSARSGFRGFFRGQFRDVEVGGKTGSLTGLSPKGRNDWFVGYAKSGDKKLAYASLTVNEERWTVKSAYVARKVIEAYF